MDRPHAFDHLAGGLAAAFLAGDWSEEELVRRGRDAIRPSPRWMRRVAAEVLACYHRPPLDRPRELARFLELQLRSLPEPGPGRSGPSVRRWYIFEQSMGRRRWPVAELDTVTQLAALLGLTDGELDWLADVRCLERPGTPATPTTWSCQVPERSGRARGASWRPPPRSPARRASG